MEVIRWGEGGGSHLREAGNFQREQDPAVQDPAVVLLGQEGLHGGAPVGLAGQQAVGRGIQVTAPLGQGVVQAVLRPLVAGFLKDGKLVADVEEVVPARIPSLCISFPSVSLNSYQLPS